MLDIVRARQDANVADRNLALDNKRCFIKLIFLKVLIHSFSNISAKVSDNDYLVIFTLVKVGYK